ncbi:MAG: hypothetical protein Q9178_002447 [Gyalolechia marmorata]
MLHLDSKISTLSKLTGVDMSLSSNDAVPPTKFKVIIQDCTSNSLILESFYKKHVAGRIIEGVTYPVTSLADLGISRVAFSTTLGNLKGEDPLGDRTAPGFKVKGCSKVPVCHGGYKFTPDCFIVDHMFGLQSFESKFVMVLGRDSLMDCFIRAQWTDSDFVLDQPPLPTSMGELIIYTDGCCLSNGQCTEKPARAGYGIHFPQLSSEWDVSIPLAETEKHTNQRAELLAVIRALQLVHVRQIPCRQIQLFTDSMYAVKGLTEWIPKWRTNGYRTAQKKPVGNADLFKILDQKATELMKVGVRVMLKHIPREQNSIADRLAKAGAEGPRGTADFSLGSSSHGPPGPPKLTLDRELLDQQKPLVQWTPDGNYWVRSTGPRTEYRIISMRPEYFVVLKDKSEVGNVRVRSIS